MSKVNPSVKDFSILVSPLVTEKSTYAVQDNKYLFKVVPEATKADVKKAVEAVFQVKVSAVNIINVKGKTKRYRGFIGKRSDFKKAIVTLKEGQTLDTSAGA